MTQTVRMDSFTLLRTQIRTFFFFLRDCVELQRLTASSEATIVSGHLSQVNFYKFQVYINMREILTETMLIMQVPKVIQNDLFPNRLHSIIIIITLS